MAKGILMRLLIALILLIGCVASMAYALFIGAYFVVGVLGLVLAWLVFIVFAIFGVNMRKVAFMFNSIENDDYAFRFSENRGVRSERIFNRSLNRIKNLVEQTRTAIAERERYYEKILSHSASGVLVIDPTSGIVFQSNRAAIEIFGVASLTHINQLSIISPEIPQILLAIEPAHSRSVSFYNEANEVCLTLWASPIDLHERHLKIISFSDIGGQIDNAQIESWTRLSRVLTHEIMNSLAPITSLSDQLLTTKNPEDLHRGLEVISSTGKGLIRFVESYRRLTRVPTPVIADFNLRSLLAKQVALFDRPIDLHSVSKNRIVQGDENLLAQVITNLLKNAVEATAADGAIWINDRTDNRGRVVVEVCNSGEKIDQMVLENIFVPFFTTKQGGSGIGLSLSRQIMRLHGGVLGYSGINHIKYGHANVFSMNF